MVSARYRNGDCLRHIANRLLGTDLAVTRETDSSITSPLKVRQPLPIIKRFGLVWTTLGEPAGGLFALPEADEEDRRVVNCGTVIAVHASGLRIVENFLDMAHFPFVHTDILGAEPHTEVMHYNAEIRRDVDEVWATNCQFFQPQAALSATGGIMTDYIYRVMTPFATLLYKTCPNAANRWDVICLFVQPLDPGPLPRPSRHVPDRRRLDDHRAGAFPAADLPAGPHHSRKPAPGAAADGAALRKSRRGPMPAPSPIVAG